MSSDYRRAGKPVDFNHSGQCMAFFDSINATDPEEAGAMLAVLLDGMADASPGPEMVGHLDVLEAARSILEFVVGEISKRYAAHPLAPSSQEQALLHQAVHLWTVMADNYRQIFLHYQAQGGEVPEALRALLLQRRMRYHTLVMLEYFRARQAFPPQVWRELHGLYLQAESLGVATARVPDPLNDHWGSQSPQDSYVAMLLVDAGTPYSRTAREFNWIVRWAQRFASECSLREEWRGGPNRYAIDFDADRGLQPAALIGEERNRRQLRTSRLALQIKAIVAKLKEGASAATLGLGEDCVQPTCRRLLMSLYRPWGHCTAGRKFPRHASRGDIQICTDLQGIAFFLEGKKFESPDEDRIRYVDFKRTEAMLTLGERAAEAAVTDVQLQAQARMNGYVQEPWAIMDKSVAGFRLIREAEGVSIEHRQLVGVRANPQERLLLAEITWMKFEQDGSLQAGVSLMPGPAKVLTLRLNASEWLNGRERYRLGFLVPGMPALKTEMSLLVPVGWYAPGRRVDIKEAQPWVARMTRLVRRGANFDRVTFTREAEVASA